MKFGKSVNGSLDSSGFNVKYPVSNINTQEPRILLQRHQNTSSSVAFVFIWLGAVTLAIATGFALNGLWLVLPYAVLECSALYVAYFWLKKQREDYEMIFLRGDDIVFESCFSGVMKRSIFNRYWLNVTLEQASANRLKIQVGSHGNRMEVGRLIPSSRKRELLAQIKSMAQS